MNAMPQREPHPFRALNLIPLPVELDKRLSMSSPSDTARGMFFNGALSAVRAVVGEPAVKVCTDIAGQVKFVDFFTYPVAKFLKLAFKAVELMQLTCGGADAAFHRLGRQAVDDFLSSASGKTLLAIVGRDPRRLLGSVPGAYRAAVSYGTREVTWKGPKSCHLSFKGDFMPASYHEGVLQAGVEAMGGKEVVVTGHATGALDADFDVSWI